jgi:REP element-mobilizing transposase RayT
LKPTRMISPPGTYFVTFLTWHRRRLFVVDNYARLFLKTLYGYRKQGKFQLHAFVLMPEHLHLLLTPLNDVNVGAGHPTDQRRILVRLRT